MCAYATEQDKLDVEAARARVHALRPLMLPPHEARRLVMIVSHRNSNVSSNAIATMIVVIVIVILVVI